MNTLHIPCGYSQKVALNLLDQFQHLGTFISVAIAASNPTMLGVVPDADGFPGDPTKVIVNATSDQGFAGQTTALNAHVVTDAGEFDVAVPVVLDFPQLPAVTGTLDATGDIFPTA